MRKKKDVIFFQNLSALLMSKFCTSNLIMAGDFNVVLQQIDKRFGNNVVQQSSRFLQSLLKEHALIDIWRNKHPHVKMFTWYRTNPRIFCRLDYFFISKDLVQNYKSSKITESIRTDHKMITLELTKKQIQQRGPGFYKFNNSLLENQEFVNRMAHEICNKKIM